MWRSEGVAPFIVGMGVLKLSFEQVREMQRWLDAPDRDVLAEEGTERYYLELTLVRYLEKA